MKIGILTLPLHTNYGGILQAYALQTVLQKMGHDVKVIHYCQHYKQYVPDPLWRRFFSYPVRFVNKYIFQRYNGAICYEKNINIARKNRDKYLKQFIASHIQYYECDTLSEIPSSEFDAIVVGSDQVWRKPYFGGHERIENAFLAFTDGWNIKRVAYAASFGRSDIIEYNEYEKHSCAQWAKFFDAISVREDSGIDICKREFGVEAVSLLDPTLLLSRADYEGISKAKCSSKAKLFYYILDETPEIIQWVNDYASKKNLESFRVNALPVDLLCSLEQRIQRPVEEWLAAFATAKEIITDSFHACVFSIIFNKPFIVLINNQRGSSRIYSLLSKFQIQDRIIHSIDELNKVRNPIEWSKVNQILENERRVSNDFIINSLNTPPRLQSLPYVNNCQQVANPYFSIIIPVYNSKEKLPRCVHSIINQSYHNFEIILVDDGSNDGSSALCDKFASTDVRIKVFHKQNSGPSAARNLGLDNAKGDWILFADSDDMLLPGALSIFSNIIEIHKDVDIIRSGYVKKGKKVGIRRVAVNAPMIIQSKEDIYLTCRNSGYGGFLWNSCISRYIALKVRMDEDISWCEDHIYTYQCLSLAHKVFFSNALTYKYSYDDASILGYGKSLSTKRKDYKMIIRAAEKDKRVKMSFYKKSSVVLAAINQSYSYKLQNALYYSFYTFNPFLWISITKKYLNADYKYLCKEYLYFLKAKFHK